METNNELNVEIIDSIFFPGLGMLERGLTVNRKHEILSREESLLRIFYRRGKRESFASRA